jgi:hypothetical protein
MQPCFTDVSIPGSREFLNLLKLRLVIGSPYRSREKLKHARKGEPRHTFQCGIQLRFGLDEAPNGIRISGIENHQLLSP